MKMVAKRCLHLLIIAMIISVFGALAAMGVAIEENTFCVENVDGMQIYYKVTNDGVFKEVEVIAPMHHRHGYGEEIPNGKVTIPETVVHNNVEYTVTSIGEKAFAGDFSYVEVGGVCNGNLKNINIPDSVNYIKEEAFLHCCNLTEIDLPYNLKVIEDGAFCCTGLISVTIPKSVTDIGEFAFANCRNLTTVISLSTKPANVDSTSFVNINYINIISPNQRPHYEFVYNSDFKIFVRLKSQSAYVRAGWPEDYLVP